MKIIPQTLNKNLFSNTFNRVAFNVSSFLPTSEIKDLESSYMDLMDNVTKIIERSILKLGNYSMNFICVCVCYLKSLLLILIENNEGGAEDDLEYDALVGVSYFLFTTTEFILFFIKTFFFYLFNI